MESDEIYRALATVLKRSTDAEERSAQSAGLLCSGGRATGSARTSIARRRRATSTRTVPRLAGRTIAARTSASGSTSRSGSPRRCRSVCRAA